mmetsp:Transcript_37027/g.104460  ORF Transcript_37027/g.104460 Transcript_37027/m.104460 type:complete len:202 (+) Transcript_37027:99-704(+)
MRLTDGLCAFPEDPLAIQILIQGLESAGKTTMIGKLAEGEIVKKIPTIGLNVEQFSCRSMSIVARDLGRTHAARSAWKHYYQSTDAIVFVVDSTDHERLDDAREELAVLLQEKQLRQAALLVFANKQDLPGAAGVAELSDRLGLHRFLGRQWSVHASCAHTGEGLCEGFEWLRSALARPRAKAAKGRLDRILQSMPWLPLF